MSIRSTLFVLLGSAALWTTAVAYPHSQEQKPRLLWQLTEGLDRPESAYYDHVTRSIFVSNIAGGPSDKDGQGWISRLNEDGEVLDAQWISGLNAPKGLRSFGDTLWVADIDRLLGISIKQAKIVYEFTLPDAKFLNDVEVDRKGNVYVSDFLANTIFQVRLDRSAYQSPTVFLQGDELQNPNGLLFVRNNLVIGRWGIGIKDDFSTETPGALIVKKSGIDSVERLTADFANIDGIEALGHGKFLVSDYIKGLVYKVDRKGKTEVIVQDKTGAADIGFIPSRKILLLPNSNDNVLKAYKL